MHRRKGKCVLQGSTCEVKPQRQSEPARPEKRKPGRPEKVPKDKSYICPNCGKVCPTFGRLKDHRVKFCTDGKRKNNRKSCKEGKVKDSKHVCQFCNKKFELKLVQRRHSTYHCNANPSKKTIKCVVHKAKRKGCKKINPLKGKSPPTF